MTTKQIEDQDKHRGRGVWLAPLPSGRSQTEERHHDRRTKASELARAHGADITGEFLISSGEDEHVPEHVWNEVMDFIRHVDASALVVLTPHEVAPGFREYTRRVDELEAANVRLVLPDPDALLGQRVTSKDRKAA